MALPRSTTLSLLASLALSALAACGPEADSSAEDPGDDPTSGQGGASGKADGTLPPADTWCVSPATGNPSLHKAICEIVIRPGSKLHAGASTHDNGGFKVCSGTAVKTGTSSWGLLTAQHCGVVLDWIDASKSATTNIYGQAVTSGKSWGDIAVRCGDGALYDVDTTKSGGPWEDPTCADDVAILHMSGASMVSSARGVTNANLRKGSGMLNSVLCASPLSLLCDTRFYLTFLWRGSSYSSARFCASGYSANSNVEINYAGLGYNTTHGDSGSGFFSADTGAKVNGVIASTQDCLKLDTNAGSTCLPWPDRTGVIAGNAVHACFPSYSQYWN
ncbi:MAG: hypothetical protein U0263_39330 [Polyangiaceae bacterium]